MIRRIGRAFVGVLVLFVVSWSNLGCDSTDIDTQPEELAGMLVQEYPIAHGATWAYQNVEAPSDQYRIEVKGTQNISAVNHWKLEYTKLDTDGQPLSGTPPDPIDFYSANGLHVRRGALTRTPGVFSRAVFILGVKAAAVGPNPVAAAYVRRTIGEDLQPLDPSVPAEQRDPIRYDEFIAGTVGMVLEGASDAVLGGSPNFQKHLPPRRLWQFPLRAGSRWVVFRTAELDRGPTVAPQPPVLAERRVKEQLNVSTPAYDGPAFLVEEWVVGLRKDESGDPIIASIDDENGDGEPDRGQPTARYWIARNIGVVKYEYEFVDLGPPPEFTRKTYQLTKYTIPESTIVDLGEVKAQ